MNKNNDLSIAEMLRVIYGDKVIPKDKEGEEK